ncbi:hypothetical protein [uncultured Serinicoccus sp.]|uniref:hypothetical protein n=1 Tax=uncultured Serinicoccus sp. TaxID=735514 RepID=UPI002618CA73|nr:hypothetical protein [uncultured Serinicoccus sp.]
MADNVEHVRHEIRFALNQLRVRNGQHEFETLTRMLARATVTRNLLPATGPVAGGGDQGRDFETFPTQLPGQVQRIGRDLGVPDRAMVGFACTLQQSDLRGKIRADVAEIVDGGSEVESIVAYCEADIPVARRHAIERDAMERHRVRLAVFDGNAIAELLSDHALFWIAETYLHLPARVLPVPFDRPDWYDEDLARWRADTDPVDTVGRLLDLAGCLHYACVTREGRPDLPFWLERLESALEPGRPQALRRRALYECVAANIRGLGDLTPADDRAAEYLDEAVITADGQELSDASVLLMYMTGAAARGRTGHAAETLHAWNVGLSQRVEVLLNADPPPGAACILLDTLGWLRLQPDVMTANETEDGYVIGDKFTDMTSEELRAAMAAGELTLVNVPLVDPAGAIGAYRRLVEVLPGAPLFPVETLGKVLTMFAPVLVDIPGYDEVVDAIDARVATTSGETTAANNALDRCQALISAERRVAALKQLHRARNGLFSGDSREQMVHATLATSVAYRELGLYMAAKQYALAAAYLVDSTDPAQHSIGLAYAAFADYHQGSWCSAAHMNCVALVSHRLLAERPMDFDRHGWLTGAFFELTQIRSLARKAGDPYWANVEGAIVRGGISEFLDDLLAEAFEGRRPWFEDIEFDEHVDRVVDDLGRPPFGDTTEVRHVRFDALGVTWKVVFRNLYADVAVGERFAAALQVLLAHLADKDLGLVPMRRAVYVTALPAGADFSVEDKASTPAESRLSVLLPAVDRLTHESANVVARRTLAAVTAAVVEVSTLSDDRFQEILVGGLEDDLLTDITFAVPYDVLWRSTVSEASFDARPRTTAPLSAPDVTSAESHPDLAAPSTRGPGYDPDRSRKEIQHRYNDLPPRMRPTLDALRNDAAFADVVVTLRDEGWRDWQILIAVHNVAKNARHTFLAPGSPDEARQLREVFMAPEPEGDPVATDLFTVEALRQALLVTVTASAQTWWSLVVRPEPLPSAAVLELLRARYGWSEDDIDHSDPFVRPAVAAE